MSKYKTPADLGAELGALVVDWANRKFSFHGMSGDEPSMTAKEVFEIVEENANKPDVEVWPLIYWEDVNQLSVHDVGGFSKAVESDDGDEDDLSAVDICDECGAEIPEEDGGSRVNDHHEPSCSLHSDNTV